MAIEDSVAALTTSTTALVNAVGAQQVIVTNAVTAFANTTSRVSNGLNNVDNTHDIDKPISTLAQTALATKQATLVSGVNISTVNGQSLLGGQPLVIVRSATSLNNVEYDSRSTLRAMSPQVDDSSVVHALGLFMWVNTQLEPDDDETCFTTANGQWLLKTPAWDLLSAWDMIEKSIMDDWIEDEPKRYAAYKLTN
jgi:hypothetical protein